MLIAPANAFPAEPGGSLKSRASRKRAAQTKRPLAANNTKTQTTATRTKCEVGVSKQLLPH